MYLHLTIGEGVEKTIHVNTSVHSSQRLSPSCCSVLQCVAVRCRVLQGVAVLVSCSVLQCVGVEKTLHVTSSVDSP